MRLLTERERQILQAVVHLYITTAEPVGSRVITRRFELGVSPATVRNTMADLEEMGYLEQLHTSSGRVPTDQGYRYYVDHLMHVQELTLSERDQIDKEYTQRLQDADDVLRQTSHLLALVTHQAGLAQAPDEERAKVRRIDLMRISEGRAAVLIADNFGRVHTMAVHMEPLDERMADVDLGALVQFLNEQLTGVFVAQLTVVLESRLREYLDYQRQLAERALRVLHLLPPAHGGQLYLEGAAQLFEQPEFQDVASARKVFGLLDERAHLMEVLRRSCNDFEMDGRKRQVIFGSETNNNELNGISLVTAPYRVGGEEVGMVGVLGPRRMPYSRLTAVVDYTASLVGKLLSQLGR